jgi:Fe-S-cluster containining protein
MRMKARKGHGRDVAQIAAMLIFLRVDKHGHSSRKSTENLRWHYTCKNFDSATNNCTAYETRPSMCRDYPYGQSYIEKGYLPRAEGQCNYRDCTRRCAPEKPIEVHHDSGEKEMDETGMREPVLHTTPEGVLPDAPPLALPPLLQGGVEGEAT